MRLALLILTLTVCWTNAQSTIANGTLNNAVLNGASSLRDGLVSYWNLDEAGTGTRYDSYGGNDLTAYNSPSSTTGKIGNCATFVAASVQALQVADSPAFDCVTNTFEITFWALINTAGNVMVAVSQYDPGFESFQVQYNGTYFRFVRQSYGITYTNVTPETNRWYFVDFYSSNSTMGISVDGGAFSTLSGLAANVNSTAKFDIGAIFSTPAYSWDGKIDEVGWWSRTLTTSERTQLYKSGTGTTFPYFSRRSQPIDFDWDNWQPLVLPEQIPVAFVNRKPTLISLCE